MYAKSERYAHSARWLLHVCLAVCCSVLLCVAMHCSVLQCVQECVVGRGVFVVSKRYAYSAIWSACIGLAVVLQLCCSVLHVLQYVQ